LNIQIGACKCCDAQREEIIFLRSLVRPKSEPKYESLPRITLEADAVISGAGDQIVNVLGEDSSQRQQEIDSERARLLSGEY
jgi:hypothetical protein